MPGDSPRFDLYDGRREFLISAKRREIHYERVSEPESHEMGLQVSRGVHTEATQETGVRCAASAPGRSRSHMHQHSAEVRGVECGADSTS